MFTKIKIYYLLPLILAFLVYKTVAIKVDLAGFIVAGETAEEMLLASEMQSGVLSRRYLISVGANNEQDVSKTFIKALTKQFKNIDGLVDVWSPGQQGNMLDSIQSVYKQHGNALYALEPEKELSKLFTVNGLQQRAKLLKQLLLSPQAETFKKIALRDPLLLSINGFQSLTKPQQITNQDNKYRNLIVETAMSGLDSSAQKRIQDQMNTIFEQQTQKQSVAYKLEMTGIPVFAAATQTLMQGDVIRISIISTIALVLLFLMVFRSFGIMFQVFTLLAIVILSSMLATQWVFGYVNGMTIAIGTTLVGICIDYPIHAVAHAQQVECSKRVFVISRIWPSMVLGGCTTMIGYMALGFSGYPGLQQVTVYAVTGILISLLLTRYVFPKLMLSTESKTLHIPLISEWIGFSHRYRLLLCSVLTILLAVSISSLNSLRWMQDMQEMTPELDYLKQQDKQIRARMSSIEPGRFILVMGENIEHALQKTESLYPVLDQLKLSGALSDYYGLYPWILSNQQQQKNQLILKDYLSKENQIHWQTALKEQGLSINKLGRFNYPDVDPINLEQLLKTPLAKLFDSRVISRDQKSLIMIWLAEHQPAPIQAAMNSIEGVQYFSQKEMLNNMSSNYTKRAGELLLLGLGCIILILIVCYKSISKSIITILPAGLAALIILAIWSFTGASISFLHLVGFLLVIAICVDYGIFYQENRGKDISLTYQAMAVSMLTSAVAFGSLITAESTSLKILAGVVALGVVIGFVLCPIIIKVEKR